MLNRGFIARGTNLEANLIFENNGIVRIRRVIFKDDTIEGVEDLP